MSRPEHFNSAEQFYNYEESTKYTSNTRMMYIQTIMADRCIQLLQIAPNAEFKLVLDVGCGSGLSGHVINYYNVDGKYGTNFHWLGVDISRNMLDLAAGRLQNREHYSKFTQLMIDKYFNKISYGHFLDLYQKYDQDELDDENMDEDSNDEVEDEEGGSADDSEMDDQDDEEEEEDGMGNEGDHSGNGKRKDGEKDTEGNEEENPLKFDDALQEQLDSLRPPDSCENKGDFILADMGCALPFKNDSFDGVISVSALQWLCYTYNNQASQYSRVRSFFENLYRIMKKGSRAVFQFYPEKPEQTELLTSAAMRAGFIGHVMIDYPNSPKAKKWYLILDAGYSERSKPTMLGEPESGKATFTHKPKWAKKLTKNTRKYCRVKTKEWIRNKKDTMRNRGSKVCNDSKYSGRKRNKK